MTAVFKQHAHRLIDALPDSAGWTELIHEAALHRAIERGLAQADAGELIPTDDVLNAFALSE